MSLKNTFRQWTVLVAALLLSASNLGAGTFQGSTSGIFLNPVGPGVPTYVWGTGTGFFQWGESMGGSPSSSLRFSSVFFDADEENWFKIGDLDYFNGTITEFTQTDSVELRVSLDFVLPTGSTESFDYTLELLNTPNTADPVESADIVYLPSAFSADLFTIGTTVYTLELAFGEVSSGGFSEVDSLFAYEGATAQADLMGRITTDIPGTPDGGVTAGLLGMALASLGTLARRKNKA